MTDLVALLLTAYCALILLEVGLLALIVHDLIEARRPAPEPEEPKPLGIACVTE